MEVKKEEKTEVKVVPAAAPVAAPVAAPATAPVAVPAAVTAEDEKKTGEEKKKTERKKQEKKPAKKVETIPDVCQLDFKVGKIIKIEKHAGSTKLYVEEIDLGNGQIRKIASGLQEHVPIEQMQDRLVVVFCNLKEKKVAGYPSYGMVLCASSADEKVIEPLLPPPGSVPGDLVSVESFERKPCPDINLSKKNNPWTKSQPSFTTAPDLTVVFNGKALKTDKGVIKTKTLVAARIS